MTREEAYRLAMKACEEMWNEKTCKQIKEALEQEPCEDATKLAETLINLRLKGEIKDMKFVRKFINDVEIQVKVSVKDTRSCFCGAELEDVSEIYRRMKGKSDGKDDN